MQMRLKKFPEKLGFLLCVWTLLMSFPLSVFAGSQRETPEELYQRAIKKLYGQKILGILPAEDPDGAIRLFEKIITEYPTSRYAPLAEVGIAEAYLKKGDPYMAIEKFKDFIERRRGHEKYPYALCKIAEAYEDLLSAVDRDLTPAHNALHYLTLLKQEYPFYTGCGDLEGKIKKLRSMLAERELYVARFYFKKGYLLAARKRLLYFF